MTEENRRKSVRCSEIDRVLACPGSLIEVAHPYRGESDVAQEGIAAHRAIERLIDNPEGRLAVVCEELAEQFGCDLDSLVFLVREALRAWSELRLRFPNPQLEFGLCSQYCHGVADLLCIGPDRAAVLDWKFGYATDEHPGQLAGYALGIRAQYGVPAKHIEAYEVHARHGKWYRRQYDDAALDELEKNLARAIRSPSSWAPSTRTCLYCPARMSCAARAGHAQNVAVLLDDIVELGTPRESIAIVYDRFEFLRKVLDDYDKALRDYLRDGDIKLQDGRTVMLKEQQRQTILVDRAWPVIRDKLGWKAEDMMQLLSIGKAKLEERIRVDLPRGEKAKGVRSFMDELLANGAIQITSTYRREVK